VLSRRKLLTGLGGIAATGIRAFARAGSVQVGVCSDSAHFADAVHYGFDYYEPEASEMEAMDETGFQEFKARVLASPIRCKAFRSLIRKLKVVGENVQVDDVRSYMDRTLGRCRQLGAEVVVWGSSGSRNVPAGFSRDRAWRQIRDFLRSAGDIARRNNLVIGIEHLRKQESNIINTVGEALRLVHEVNHPNVKMIVDFYHLRKENEDPEVIWQARAEIVHLHFANPAGRTWPKSPSEDPEYRPFFDLIKKIEYRGGISIEAPAGNFQDDAVESLRFFQEMLA
jgi:sugar phosphate isomerase/epimerase